ncbi:hypothetical protein J6590_067858 [Homalodisca vitripennis]|nr:hypothetical protein J6590_067858 [Homalodisca vitripennis]
MLGKNELYRCNWKKQANERVFTNENENLQAKAEQCRRVDRQDEASGGDTRMPLLLSSLKEKLNLASFCPTSSISPSIRLTMEAKIQSKLPSLDVYVVRDKDVLKTTVYRKKTYTEKYLNCNETIQILSKKECYTHCFTG